ncbi:transporter suffix domain-containing protein [Stenotrophomonas pavanii]|uniref:transporter suffix domain-containing protein n=1 Tax=Stenotrophomonas pavanii TaxID=487698 RepID=UPI0013135F96
MRIATAEAGYTRQTRQSGSSLKKKVGLVLLALVAAYWISFPFVALLDIPYKALIISSLVVLGEALFLIAVALLGKEYWGRIKSGTRSLLARVGVGRRR